MEKEFVGYNEALSLKELGFDEPCLGHYQDRDETTLHGAVLTSNNVRFFIGETNKGFIVINSPVSHCVLAPLYQQAFRWFRERYDLYSHVRESLGFDNTLEFVSQINGSYVNHGIADKPVNRFETYEEAELECLKKLISIVKEKNQ